MNITKLMCTVALIFILPGCAERLESVKTDDPVKPVDSSNAVDNRAENDLTDGQIGVIESDTVSISVGNPQIPASPSPGTFDQAVYDSLGAAEFSYGGLNYDKWYLAAGVANIPTTNHPLWTGTSPDVINEDTWRCKECHGWDYQGVDGVYGLDPAGKHFSGICGILNTANCPNTFTTAQEIWTFLHDGGTTPGIANPADHAFADWLPDDEIYALTKFIMTILDEAAAGNAPADQIASDPASPMFKMAMGNQGNGFELYSLPSEEGGCDVGCHGVDGTLIDFDTPNGKFVDTYANDNPWEVLHKIRFGHPGSDPYMPGIAEYDDARLDYQAGIDILSYSQAGLIRSHISGGRLYDNWIVETGADATQAIPNPILAIAPNPPASGEVSDVDSWRCSQCHGYDFEGGAFGFVNNLVELQSINSWSFDYVYSVLKNGYSAVDPATSTVMTVHQFSDFMTDQQLWDLADFAVEEIFDTHTLIRAATGGIREAHGDSTLGHHIYNGLIAAAFPDGSMLDCLTCHGADGKLAVRTDGSPTDLFLMSWSMPWQYFHQTKFGTPRLPGTVDVMPGLLEVTRQDGHAVGNHDVADVQIFSQINLLSSSPATVAEIQRARSEGTWP